MPGILPLEVHYFGPWVFLVFRVALLEHNLLEHNCPKRSHTQLRPQWGSGPRRVSHRRDAQKGAWQRWEWAQRSWEDNRRFWRQEWTFCWTGPTFVVLSTESGKWMYIIPSIWGNTIWSGVRVAGLGHGGRWASNAEDPEPCEGIRTRRQKPCPRRAYSLFVGKIINSKQWVSNTRQEWPSTEYTCNWKPGKRRAQCGRRQFQFHWGPWGLKHSITK